MITHFFGPILDKIEYFENENKDVVYNEDNGMFTILNKSFFGLLNLGNTHVYDKDVSINKMNELKELSENTTLTEYDIDILYEFAKLEFNYQQDKNAFVNEPLKNIFVTLSNDKLMIHKLMPMAYDYLNAIKKGEKPIIEKFTVDYEINKPGLVFLCFIIFFLFLIYFLYLCYLHK